LFLQSAYYILQEFPFARFRFIGSGPLTKSLKMLTKRLNIDYAIEFTGWIASKDLPKYLMDVDIVLNPSLRGWSETFCITNIEVMYLGIPLVTFAVGGN
jgi:glycosyltransferase involved in cell wall biosynthesis